MKIGKLIGGIAAGTLLLAAVPFRIRKDEETGAFELRSILWGLRKIPGEEKNGYTFAMPASGLDEDPKPETGKPDEAPTAEEAAEATADPGTEPDATAQD